MKQLHDASKQNYGSCKIAFHMQEDNRLETACRNTVATTMRDLGLKNWMRKKFSPTAAITDPMRQPAENLLDQRFTATAPNQKWVTDTTCLPTAAGWVCLAVVLDLFSRKVVGWSISTSLATELVSDALRQAIEQRRPNRGKCCTTAIAVANTPALHINRS